MNALITLFILSLLSIGQATARLDSSQRVLAKPSCGDNKCNGGETCVTCPGDCGECEGGGSFCGDGTCDATEDCSCEDCACNTASGETCDATGVCISCGDGTCNGDEDCNSCPFDCGYCSSPNCPPEATSCVCTDGTTSCSSDNDCPGTTTEVSGTCAKGSMSGLSCTSNSDCPWGGNRFADCVGGGTTEEPPAEGSCRACSGVQVSSGLIAGNIDQCSEGFLCGDFSKNTNPVDCEPCLPDMTCDTWCKDAVSLGDWIGQSLESHMASSSCGSDYDACTCTMSSWWANSWTVASNTHAGAICDAHQFDRYDDCSTPGWCLEDYPDDDGSISPYCRSLKVTAITGELLNGVCTCSATVTSDDQLYIETKPVWSSECIENLYLYDLDGFDPQSVGLPCSFTG